MNYNKYNPRCNSRTKWSCGDDGAVGEDDVDDDPDEARGDDDGDNFPGRFLERTNYAEMSPRGGGVNRRLNFFWFKA